jgi:autotransporter-associated beta strand protein
MRHNYACEASFFTNSSTPFDCMNVKAVSSLENSTKAISQLDLSAITSTPTPQNRNMKPSVKYASLAMAALLAVVMGEVKMFAANQTWGANNSTAWYTGANWAGGAFPGLQGVGAANSDIATWTAAATNTTFGINMGTASLNLGAISADLLRGNTNTSIGDSSATPGSLRLYGATVNGVSDVVLRNNSSGLLTLQALQSGIMSLILSNSTANKIYIDGSGGITISCNISGYGLSLAGAGSGILTLNGTNSFPGGVTVNSGNTVSALDSLYPWGTGTLTLNGGTYLRGVQAAAFAINRSTACTNPVSVTANSTIQTSSTTTRTIHLNGPFSGLAGTTLLITNTATTGSNRLHKRH